jgi:hypothetical protein
MSAFSNLFNFLFVLVFQIFLLCVSYLFVRLLFRQELGWKLLYFVLSSFFTFLVGASGAPSLLNYLLRDFGFLEDRFIIRDGNSFVALLMELALFSTFLFVVPLLIFFVYSYLSSSLTVFEREQFFSAVILFIYLYCVIFLVVDKDLSRSTWDTVLATEKLPLHLQLQPDLDFLFLSYRGEWSDFFIFVLMEALLFLLFYQGYMTLIWREPSVHFLLLILHLLGTFYFFCGEGFLFDVILLTVSMLFFELLYFQLRFFFFLRTRRA